MPMSLMNIDTKLLSNILTKRIQQNIIMQPVQGGFISGMQYSQIRGFPAGLSSVQFSHSVMSDSLQPHELQHTRLPCPLPTPGTCSNSCPLSQ